MRVLEYWLSLPSHELWFKEIDPDIMEEPNLLFKYLYDDSLVMLHNTTRIKQCNKNVERMDPSSEVVVVHNPITMNEMNAFCGSIFLTDIYQFAQLECVVDRSYVLKN